MSKGQEEIHEFHAARRLNILKGFKEVSEVPPVSLKELQEQVGKENVYTYEVLKGFTQKVIEKGVESDRLAAKEQISSLTPISVVDERGLRQVVYVQKGHMDFDSGGSGGGRQGLVKKQITDKTGRNTTKWVRANQDEGGEEKQPKSEDENADGTKPISEHAKETSSEDLKAYLEKNPDGEHATHAKRELQVRGEIEGGDDTAGEGAEESAPELDFNNSEAVKQYLADNPETKERMMAIIEEDLFISPISALKQAMKGDKDQSETHAAIDEAQASLDALKEKTGHPQTQQTEEGDDSYDMDSPEGKMEYLSSMITEGGEVDEDLLLDYFDAVDGTGGFDPSSEKNFINTMKELSNYMSKDEVIAIAKQENPDAGSLIEDYWPDNVDGSKEDSEDSSDDEPTGYENIDESDIYEDLGEFIFNSQGRDNSDNIREAVTELRRRGISDENIKAEMGRGQWDDSAMMSDEEKQGMEEDFDAAMSAVGGGKPKNSKDGDDKMNPDKSTQNDVESEQYDEGYDDSIMADLEDAIGEEFGLGAEEEGRSLHVDDIKQILENYDVMSNDPDSQTGIMDTSTDEKMQDSIKRIVTVMKRNGWSIEGA